MPNYKSENIKPYGDEGTKRQQVEQMFDNIAPTYDVLNHTLSFGVDRLWRRKAIKFLKPFSPKRILDIATGTGDFAILANEILSPEKVTGIDISEGMMQIGREKVARLGLTDKIELRKDDCVSLSFGEASFDAVVSAFALRNFQHIDQCMAEMYRVLAPGGHISVIDLATPVSFPMKQLFWLYKKTVMPILGRFLSKDNLAYTYLPDSMDAVPQGEAMQSIIAKAGFRNAQFKRLIFGMAVLYTAEK